MKKKIKKIIENHFDLRESVLTKTDSIKIAFDLIKDALDNNCKIIFCGNGGSAADSQHLAAEFVGRFVKERKSLPAISLTTDSSAITAIGNDYGFDRIFERQLDSIGHVGDVLVGISTSGNSLNIINAFKLASKKKIITISLTGNKGGLLKSISDLNINVDSSVTARIQEIHILIGHILCELVDDTY
tara:strand:- start:401 stop:961 length:561 start_codon:yes stop_codon:yes gene_type:complete